jgi:hypothetical protein
MKRDICSYCQINLVAVNYKRDGKTYYRSRCSGCIRKNKKLKPQPPAWVRSGYKKTAKCEICQFQAKIPAKQLFVYHVDGNLKNNNWHNLKTVCANCRVELIGKVSWKPASIVPDF